MGSTSTATAIATYLDALLQVSRYDEGELSNGLVLAAPGSVGRIAAAVNASFTAIQGAATAGAALLLVHHPTWASIDLHLKGEKEAALRAADISLYGAHIALDSHPDFGSSDILARRLGLDLDGRFASSCGGIVGVYGRAAGPFCAFVERIRSTLGVPVETWQNSATFGRVGLVTGGGGWTTWLEEARQLGCDTYLTGEASLYTKLFAREVGMNLISATHYGTEQYGIQALAEHVSHHFQLPWSFVPEDPDIL